MAKDVSSLSNSSRDIFEELLQSVSEGNRGALLAKLKPSPEDEFAFGKLSFLMSALVVAKQFNLDARATAECAWVCMRFELVYANIHLVGIGFDAT